MYVNGKKKAMCGEGYTNIFLNEGEYKIVVRKAINEQFEYKASKNAFVGEDTSSKINFALKKKETKKWKKILAKKQLIWEKEYKKLNKKLIVHSGLKYGIVKSPYTSKIWLDRNLGAKRVCQSFDDKKCYGVYELNKSMDDIKYYGHFYVYFPIEQISLIDFEGLNHTISY